MGQPRAYSRVKNFTLNFGSETDHSALNAELDAAGNSINDIRTNIAILQADDGKLRPDVVTSDSISAELRASLVAGVTADTVALRDAAQASANSAASSANVATSQAGLATTNGAAQVALATTQAGLATTQAANAGASATASASSATASANSATAAAGSATSAQASVASAGLPGSIVGKALNWLRVKADELGYELRTAAQALADLGAAARGANNDITSLTGLTDLPSFSATFTGPQSTSGSNQIVVNGFEEYDTHNAYDIATYTFTAPVAGKYHFDIAVSFTPITTAGSAIIQLTKNGLGARQARKNLIVGEADHLNISSTLILAVGDTVAAQLFGGVAVASINGTNGATHFSGFRVR